MNKMHERGVGRVGYRLAQGFGAAIALLFAAACPKGDVGAPCNHGQIDAPPSDIVTFPALSCNDLLCVYADSSEPPKAECSNDDDCNEGNLGVKRFECVSKRCQLSNTYVLQRSMCSKRCSSDADCKDGGPTKKVVAEGTQCAGGFSCARIQTLGELCCERLCVCNDDLSKATVDDIDRECRAGTQVGCCDGDVVPPACGT